MALRVEEILRIKAELGYNITGVGAEVYIQYVAVFDRAVQPYLIDYSTTSSTSVTAASGGASTTIVLASNPTVTGSTTQTLAFVVGSAVVVDVGDAQETSIITALSGLSATMVLSKAHSGSYPVALLGAEQYIRDILVRLDAIASEMTNIAPKTAGVDTVDEVKFHKSAKGGLNYSKSKFDELLWQREIARQDLAAAIGVPYASPMRKNRGSRLVEIY